jgi:hypothetical protein
VRLSSILRHITVLNCILIAGILAVLYIAIARMTDIAVKLPAPVAAAVGSGQKTEQATDQVVAPPMQDYAVIAEKNLFHPERLIPAEKKEADVPKPEFVLYGTLIVDNVRIAYISDKKSPRSTPGRGKRQVALKIGEVLSGYTLKEVLPDSAVMMRGDDRIDLKVISPENKKERGTEGVAGMPGTGSVQPAMPNPAVPQTAHPSSVMPQMPSGQASPRIPTPGMPRSRRPMGR